MKYISFTFDDGRRDNYLYAYPIMKKYGIKGTLFCTTGYIDESWKKDESWHSAGEPIHVEELRELEDNGWELALHGDKHTTEVNDLKCASKKMEQWGFVNRPIGFSMPNSNIAKEKLNAANAEATKIKNELNSITQDNLSNSQKISSVKKLIADFEKCFHSIPIVGGYQVSNTDYKKVCKAFQKIMLTGNDLDSKSAKVEEKLNSLAKVEEKLKRQEEVNDKKANELRVKEQNLLNRNSLLSVTELENASLKLKQQAYSSNVSEIVELLNKFFKGNIPLELKKVLLKAFQEVGLKPNEKLNLDTSDLDKTKNKKIERSNYFER